MKRFKVILSPHAIDLISEQVNYIADRSLANALAWEARLLAAISRLGDHHGHAIDEVASRRLGYFVRKTVFERTYLLHYRVDDTTETVIVVSFRHGARLPSIGEP